MKNADTVLHRKDDTPENTVKKIKAILKKYGIRTKLTDMKVDVSSCYSCHLSIDDETYPFFSSNGKGTSEGLCLASAYAELIERLQNRIFMSTPRNDDLKYDELYINQNPIYDVKTEKQPLPIERFKNIIKENIANKPLFMSKESLIDSFLNDLAPEHTNGSYPTLPFYSLREKKFVYLPVYLLILFTGSNGMAAGNTLEEAMVEGISEILERYSQITLFNEDIVPPEIPREVISQFESINRIISDIEKNENYEVRVLDCSLGKCLPVVCGMVINKENGTLGIKFGAHPDMQIALERVFTEAMQGRNLDTFSKNNYVSLYSNAAKKRVDMWNVIKVGIGGVPARLLMSFVWKSFTGCCGVTYKKKYRQSIVAFWSTS